MSPDEDERDTKAISFLGARFHSLSCEGTLAAINQRLQAGRFTQHGALNVAKLVHMRTDPVLRDAVMACDIINPDGMGVVWGARILGHDVPERVTGVDLFDALLALAENKKWPVFFLGARDEVLQKAVSIIKEKHPLLPIAGYHHGYFWDDEKSVVDQIQASKARLLFVAITPPKKEIFINKWSKELGVDFVMGVGGTFDIVAGKTRRAPKWMQAGGMEWLYRLIQEPRRMWKRYLVTNAIYLWLLMQALWSDRLMGNKGRR